MGCFFLSMVEESSKFLYIRKTLKNTSLNYNFWFEYRNLIFYDILWTVFWKHVCADRLVIFEWQCILVLYDITWVYCLTAGRLMCVINHIDYAIWPLSKLPPCKKFPYCGKPTQKGFRTFGNPIFLRKPTRKPFEGFRREKNGFPSARKPLKGFW